MFCKPRPQRENFWVWVSGVNPLRKWIGWGVRLKAKASNGEVLDLRQKFANAIEAAAIQLKREIARIVKVPIGNISEEPFLNLKWEKS